MLFDLLQNGDNTFETAGCIGKRQPKLISSFGRFHDECLVERSSLGARHCGLQLTEDSELLLKGNIIGGRNGTDVFDCIGHLGSIGFERRHSLCHGSGECGGPFHIAHIRHDWFENPVSRGEGTNHLLCGRFGGLGCETGHVGENTDGLIAEIGQRRFYVVGGGDKSSLVRSRPLVCEGFGSVFDSAQILDPK